MFLCQNCYVIGTKKTFYRYFNKKIINLQTFHKKTFSRCELWIPQYQIPLYAKYASYNVKFGPFWSILANYGQLWPSFFRFLNSPRRQLSFNGQLCMPLITLNFGHFWPIFGFSAITFEHNRAQQPYLF